MKFGKRRLFMALMAASCLTAVMVPAMAAATVIPWKKNGTAVTSSFELGLTGGQDYEVENSAGGVNCSEHMTLSYNSSSKLTYITKFENKGCNRVYGTYAKCSVQNVEALGLPWPVDLEGTSALKVYGYHVKHTFKTGCAKPAIDYVLTMPVSLSTPSAISEMEFNGTLGTYKQYGSFSVDSPNTGVYGL